MNLRKGKNSQYLSIRAREGVTACLFVPSTTCLGCGFGESPESCSMVGEVPQGTDPRDWYLDLLAAARTEAEAVA